MFSQVINALKQDTSSVITDVNFAAEYKLTIKDLHIEVDSLGVLNMPIDCQTIKSLLTKSSPARFGLREKTLLDTAVRDTQEIPASLLNIQVNNDAFSKMLDSMRKKLGLSDKAKLSAHLHNMLIYEAGQFFKPHQDSEKLDGMIATLVVVLPSPHIGGDLRIEHNRESHRFVSEQLNSQDVKCVAFYANCHHEVEKIREGDRVALTYNLVLEPANNQLEEMSNPSLLKALAAWFDSDQDVDQEPPNLVYFLDHDYSEHSLNWNMLKGNDAQNGMAFQHCAAKLDLIPHLALVELHESWTSDGDEEEPLPEDLIDGNTELTYWLDANNKKLPYKNYSVSEDEVCWTKDTEAFEPVETEYEGWMGNYGNTVDYWYRRAAIVLWRKSAQMTMDFKLNYDNALKKLVQLTKTQGNQKEVLSIIQQAGAFLRCHRYEGNSENYKLLLQIACYLQNPDIAKAILLHFDINCIAVNIIDELVALQTCYGFPWCLELFEKWINPEHKYQMNTDQFFTNMKGFVRQAFASGVDIKLLQFLLQYQLNLMIANDKRSISSARPIEWINSRSQRIERVKQFIHSCAVLPDDSVTRLLIEHLITYSSLYNELDLADILQKHQNDMVGVHQSAYACLQSHIKKNIHQALEKGEPDEADWTIEAKFSCDCERCKVAQEFFCSKTEIKKVWPLNAEYRDHIIAVMRDYDLPVNHSVEKTGSPHKLIMIKTARLYQQAKERFDKLLTYMEAFSQ